MVKRLNHKEVSSRGGKKTLKKYGRDHFAEIGRKGGEANLKKYGPDYFEKLSKAGVKARILRFIDVVGEEEAIRKFGAKKVKEALKKDEN